MPAEKPRLSVPRILQMNLGFLGLQFSFGLQQANPIFAYLGAEEKNFPWLGIAGPLTGLIVQPIIGAMSDKTLSRFGRRTPYFLIGALMCSMGLFLMPFSRSLLMAFSILFLLDVGNNVTMEPYRAYVNDRLGEEQRGFGFLSQSGFTGLAQCLAYASPFLLVNLFGISKVAPKGVIPDYTRLAFFIGAVLSITTILWSILRVPELPLTTEESAAIAAAPKSLIATLAEIWDAIVHMPTAMRKLAVMSLFQWYGMAAYWGYVIYSIGRSVYHTSDPHSEAFRTAVLTNGEMAAFFNAVAFVAAFALIPVSKRFGAGRVHAVCLVAAGLGMLAIPEIDQKALLFLPAVGLGFGWASIMGNPYVVLAGAIPPARTGVYMGIFNMMIVIPMLLIAATLPFYYGPWMGGDPRNVLRMAGVLLILGAGAAMWAARTDKAPQ